MPEYLLKIRRFDPKSGEAAYWDEHRVELGGRNSVLDAILKVRDEVDGSVGIRCSCQQAICGSCGVRMNGKPGLACNTHLEEAAARTHGAGWNAPAPGDVVSPDAEEGDGAAGTTPAGVIEVEPMGNMPVIRDLIVDMDAVHWRKIQRVTPYLINKQPIPEREYIVPHENMVDITQTMACIQCGACVSDCLSMEIDPLFIGPAALAKAYRFVGDPRDAEHSERLKDLSEDEHGLYDCTHCFNCIDACPKEVAPMSQIMRLRRRAGNDFKINDRNNGHRHEDSFVTLVRDYGLLHEAELLPRSFGGNSWFGKFHPAAGGRAAQVAGRDRPGGPAREGQDQDRDLRPQDRQARSRRRAADVQEGRRPPAARGAQPVRERLRGRPRAGARRRVRPARRRIRSAIPVRLERKRDVMKVAYWPGCVSRGFTPELHGSMAKVAPLLDIELIELDRAACCGAGVIAEHNQELADTLNARTFALAQQTDGELMMNICSTCQGAQSECQERLDANTEYRDFINQNLSDEGLAYETTASPTRTCCGCWSRRSASMR